jgi:aromatic ring-opening dioxygenase catalytic subunit (LigB family)
MQIPSYFISHGAGPWPFMKSHIGTSHDVLEAALRDIPAQLARHGYAKPHAVLVISAHWEMPQFTVLAQTRPDLLYDYGGFPPETYRVRYAAPGAPELAQRVATLLRGAGLDAAQETRRGWDHGVFVPLSVMYPEADVPVLQLSMQIGYDPATHLAAGRALAPLRNDGVLIIGSGLSYHNQRPRPGSVAADSAAFDAWLGESLIGTTAAERAQRLMHWAAAPGGRASHPHEDHLIPLLVAAGAAEHEPAARVYHEARFFGAATVSSFRFGAIGAVFDAALDPV